MSAQENKALCVLHALSHIRVIGFCDLDSLLTSADVRLLQLFFEGLGGTGDLEPLVLLLPPLYEWWLYGFMLMYLIYAVLRLIPGS